MLTLSLWVVLCFVNQYYFNATSFQFHAFLNPIITEFFFGCLIALFYSKYRVTPYSLLFLVLGIFLFILSAIYRHSNVNYREIYFGLPAALIIYGLIEIKKHVPKLFVYLGDASYTIYLFHYLVFGLIVKVFELLYFMKKIDNGFGLIFTALLTLCICCLIYEWIEKPILHASKKLLAYYYKRPNFNDAVDLEVKTNPV
jgi:peptidoglycan/LPS O-acetylase OafA/YrhL